MTFTSTSIHASSRPRPRLLRQFALAFVPLVLFYLADAYLDVVWGVAIALLWGVGELVVIYVRERRIDRLTLGFTLSLVLFGGISIVFKNGLAFKLQPAIVEVGLAAVLLISHWRGRPLLTVLYERQGNAPATSQQLALFSGITFRLSLFFMFHAAITVYTAIWASNGAWIMAKGPLFYGMLVGYFALEVVIARLRIKS